MADEVKVSSQDLSSLHPKEPSELEPDSSSETKSPAREEDELVEEPDEAESEIGNLGESSQPHVEPKEVKRAEFQQLSKIEGAGGQQNIQMILDVTLPISIELGRTSMTVGEILELGSGSVVELNKLAGEPVDVLVNDKIIARGEVVVVDENFGVRITHLISKSELIKNL